MPNAPPSPPSVRAISSRSEGSDALICVTRNVATLPTALWTRQVSGAFTFLSLSLSRAKRGISGAAAYLCATDSFVAVPPEIPRSARDKLRGPPGQIDPREDERRGYDRDWTDRFAEKDGCEQDCSHGLKISVRR